MPYRALLQYVRTAKELGASDDVIEQHLHSAGWYKVDIQDALELYRRLTTPAVVATQASQQDATTWDRRVAVHHYDPNLIAVAAVSFAVGFLAYLWLVQY